MLLCCGLHEDDYACAPDLLPADKAPMKTTMHPQYPPSSLAQVAEEGELEGPADVTLADVEQVHADDEQAA